jgi:hypothetical protein
VPRKLDRSSAPPADEAVDAPLHPARPPILAVVQEQSFDGQGVLHLRVSLRAPGGRVVESRVVTASPDAAGAALAAVAVGWAVALDPAFADHPVRVVRP